MSDREMMGPAEGIAACKALSRWFQSQKMSVGEGAGVAALLIGHMIGHRSANYTEIEVGIEKMVKLIRATARRTMMAKDI